MVLVKVALLEPCFQRNRFQIVFLEIAFFPKITGMPSIKNFDKKADFKLDFFVSCTTTIVYQWHKSSLQDLKATMKK